MSSTRYIGRHRAAVEQISSTKNFLTNKLTRRIGVPIIGVALSTFVMANMASAQPINVSPGDTFSGLVATYCGSSDWQDVSFPGRDKNLIFAGETIDITCPGQQSNADVAAQNTPAPPPPPPAAPAPVQAPVSCNAPATPHWWNDTQWGNARIIVQVGIDLGISKWGMSIALATAMQESQLYNLANPWYPSSYNYPHDGEGYDHDSLGLFQQRSSTGWGSVAEIMNPWYAASAFYNHLASFDYWNYSLGGAAQRVQVSAFPGAYSKWTDDATDITNALVC